MNTEPQFVGSVPENYERYLVPSIFAPWAEELVEVAGLRPSAGARHRLRDGVVARTAARRLGSGGNVTGLDLSADARCCPLGRDVGGAIIEWRERSALQLPFADGCSMSFLSAGSAVFPDRPVAMGEMYRVLAPVESWCSRMADIERSPGLPYWPRR
jgi:hypothetical protein